jgi:hypothetical protein
VRYSKQSEWNRIILIALLMGTALVALTGVETAAGRVRGSS